MADHDDETGQPCKKHAAPSEDSLMALATIGSRMPGFHHDCASKLQSLMMSLDEITELATTQELQQSVATANESLRELHALFTANRALAKSPQLTRELVKTVIDRSAERAGVKARGKLDPVEVEITPPAMTHAMSLLLDVVAGPATLGRIVDVSTVSDGAHVAVTLAGPPTATTKPPPNVSELLAIASYVIARDGGELRCVNGGESFVIRLLVAH